MLFTLQSWVVLPSQLSTAEVGEAWLHILGQSWKTAVEIIFSFFFNFC